MEDILLIVALTVPVWMLAASVSYRYVKTGEVPFIRIKVKASAQDATAKIEVTVKHR